MKQLKDIKDIIGKTAIKADNEIIIFADNTYILLTGKINKNGNGVVSVIISEPGPQYKYKRGLINKKEHDQLILIEKEKKNKKAVTTFIKQGNVIKAIRNGVDVAFYNIKTKKYEGKKGYHKHIQDYISKTTK